jgi:hypothetical protein
MDSKTVQTEPPETPFTTAPLGPYQVLNPQPVSVPRSLTTAERPVINQNPTFPAPNLSLHYPFADPQGAGAATDDTAKDYLFVNREAANGLGVPPSAPLVYVSDEFQPAVGVYVMSAPTGAGKTVLSCALVAWANSVHIDAGPDGVLECPATYQSCYEPRSTLGSNSAAFTSPTAFLQDATNAITPLVTRAGSTRPLYKMVIFDSVTLPMKAYAANYPNQATFTGGSQPSDRGFLDALAKLANEKGACIIITLNSTLMPYVNDLRGAVEGLLTIQTIGSFVVNDRTGYSARENRSITIPPQFVNAALIVNGFGPLRQSSGLVPQAGLNARTGMYAHHSKLK